VTRSLILTGLALWAGATLLLSQLRWIARPRLVDRLRPYSPGRHNGSGPALSATTFGEVIGPLAAGVGASVARLTGRDDDLAQRLERTHSPVDPAEFRVRQLAWAASGVAVSVLVTLAVHPPALLLVASVPAGALAGYAWAESRLTGACRDWDRRRTLELPVLAEQLAMLSAAGFSLGAALSRVASRGRGACAMDLARVCGRIRQGLSEPDALREWASIARSPAVERLVAVLCLSGETGDLGRLLSEEARSIRRQVQRQAVETMDRRAQQVWIPVTVAALIPGVVLLAVPFMQALRLFASG